MGGEEGRCAGGGDGEVANDGLELVGGWGCFEDVEFEVEWLR